MQKNQKQITSSIPTVSELTADIKELLEYNFSEIMVEGEISNANTSRSGHTYFTLKDENAQLPCVLWRSVGRKKDITIEDGEHVVAGGNIEVYPPHGKYQLIIRFLQRAGVGALQQAFEELKRKLKKEGLFDPSAKTSLPAFPRRIGVITSSTGAAFHDISTTLAKRWPMATIYLYHASVQGDRAAPEIVEGIKYFSEQDDIDVLIIGRGGGSLEDLWPFNEEAVARALYQCPIPTVSAVGHEVDFSISDFVADQRAATPTQAAIVVSPDINEIRFKVDEKTRALEKRIERSLEQGQQRVEQLIKAHALRIIHQQVTGHRERIQSLQNRLKHVQEISIRNARDRWKDVMHRLQNLNPNEPLERGFSRIFQNGEWIRQADSFQNNEDFTIQWKGKEIKIDRG